MKITLDIELDWIDEESNLDETVKRQIIDGVSNKILTKIEKQVEGQINKTIDDTVVAKINELTTNLFNDFMNRQVVITDRYGDKGEVYENMTALMKKRFDLFMDETVDDKGKIPTSSYDRKHKRIVFIIDKQLKEFADKFTTNAVKQVSEEIKAHVHDGLTNKLGAELMKVLKVEKMLQLKQ